MTTYAGELVRVSVTAEDFDEEALTEEDVDSVVVVIYDSSSEVVVAEVSMTWNADDALWFYLWDTDGIDAGTYKAQCRMIDLDGHSSWEWQRVRLARNPV